MIGKFPFKDESKKVGSVKSEKNIVKFDIDEPERTYKSFKPKTYWQESSISLPLESARPKLLTHQNSKSLSE